MPLRLYRGLSGETSHVHGSHFKGVGDHVWFGLQRRKSWHRNCGPFSLRPLTRELLNGGTRRLLPDRWAGPFFWLEAAQ